VTNFVILSIYLKKTHELSLQEKANICPQKFWIQLPFLLQHIFICKTSITKS